MNERITLKTFMGDYALDCESESEWEKAKNKAFNKLGQLEDIEQELNVDLIKFLKQHKSLFELMTMSDEQLIERYLDRYKYYLTWTDSTDGSDGAAWEYEVVPVIEELKNRGIYNKAEQKRKEAGIGYEN